MEREIYDRMRALEQSHWWFTARRVILDAEIERLEPGPEILEVGCGTGGNLAMLSRFGHVQGLEPDDASRAYAASRTGVEVKGGLLPGGLPAFDRPFDLIAAFDVIEHVEDDAGAVAALAKLLAPGGRMIATVPAYAWMWSSHDEHHHHKRRYTRAAFRRLLERAGLKVRRATYFNALLFPPIAAVRLLRILLRRSGGDDDALPSPPVNRLLAAIFAFEKRLLRLTDIPFGVSILAIAERPA